MRVKTSRNSLRFCYENPTLTLVSKINNPPSTNVRECYLFIYRYMSEKKCAQKT